MSILPGAAAELRRDPMVFLLPIFDSRSIASTPDEDWTMEREMERQTLLTMLVHGLGLNMSGLLLLAGAGAIFGPLGWSGMVVALLLKLIGDSHLIRAYWLWQTRRFPSQTNHRPVEQG